MEPISLALGLSELIPAIVGWFGNEDDAETANKIIDVAKSVAGINNAMSAVEDIKNNPSLHIEFKKAMQPIIISRLEENTKRLQATNETMRAEYASKSWYISGWRPTFGYIVAFSWLFMMVALGLTIISEPAKAPAIINAMASLSFMWGIALAVLGVNVQQRSKDKQLAAGQAPVPGILSTLTHRLIK